MVILGITCQDPGGPEKLHGPLYRRSQARRSRAFVTYMEAVARNTVTVRFDLGTSPDSQNAYGGKLMRVFPIRRLFCGAALLAAALVNPVQASLTLTQAGTNDGFTLTTFVSGYNAQYGPLAQGIAPDGNVITGSALGLKVYVFSDVDNQTLASALTSVSYTAQTGNPNFAMTTAGGQVYGVQLQGNGVFEHFASNGAFTPIPNLQAAGLFGYLGMWGDPVNGHIIASSNRGLVDIDPLAGAFRVVNASLFPDGATVSPDGGTVYVENGGTVQSYDLTTGTLIHTFNTGHSPDGTGVISGGNFSGDVIVNDNDGTVGLLDPTKPIGDPSQFVIIASGGTRGDFVSADTSNGTLFLSQNEQVARLSCGPDCAIGSTPPPTSAPEPTTFGLIGGGLGAVMLLRSRRKAGVRITGGL